MNNKSNNGKLIEEIITNYVNENIFESTTEFKESLQETLNSTLEFATKVNNIENKNGFSIGNVQFENENGINSVIDFTIAYNNKTIESYE
jgi:hypothetical protein